MKTGVPRLLHKIHACTPSDLENQNLYFMIIPLLKQIYPFDPYPLQIFWIRLQSLLFNNDYRKLQK